MSKKPGPVPISMATLTPGAMVGIDIYWRPSPGAQAELLFRRDEPAHWPRLEDSQRVRSSVLINRLDRIAYV